MGATRTTDVDMAPPQQNATFDSNGKTGICSRLFTPLPSLVCERSALERIFSVSTGMDGYGYAWCLHRQSVSPSLVSFLSVYSTYSMAVLNALLT